MLQTLLALRNRQGKRGFTLIELLVVVAIIGILATFAFPRVYEAMQKVNDGKGRTAIKSLSTALEQEYFKSSSEGTAKYPTDVAATLKSKLSPYMKTNFEFKNGHGAGYLYLTDTGGKGYVLVDVKRIPVGSDITVCGVDFTITNDLVVDSTLTPTALASCALPAGATWDADGAGSGTAVQADIYFERN